jgi:hypothetical protein
MQRWDQPDILLDCILLVFEKLQVKVFKKIKQYKSFEVVKGELTTPIKTRKQALLQQLIFKAA